MSFLHHLCNGSRHRLLLTAVVLLPACSLLPVDSNSTTTTLRHARSTAATPQWQALRQTLDKAAASAHEGIVISPLESEDGLRLSIPASDGFASGSSAIRASLATMLDQLAPVLATEAGAHITVIGHTDSIGSEMYNLRLSIERAEAVQAYLAGQGVSLSRLHADGHGEAEPIADNASEEGRARNRRVELILRARS